MQVGDGIVCVLGVGGNREGIFQALEDTGVEGSGRQKCSGSES